MAYTPEEIALLKKIKDKNKVKLAEIATTSEKGIAVIKDAIETVEDEVPEGDYKNKTKADLIAEIEEQDTTLTSLLKVLDKPEESPLLEERLEDGKKDRLPHKFRNLSHLMVDMALEGRDRTNTSPELEEWREVSKANQSAGDPATGGALIPTEFVERIMERARAQNPIMANATVIPMETGKVAIPFIDGFDESQGKTFGNGQFYWEGESQGFTETNALFGTTELNLRKIAASVRVTWEMIKYSAISIEPILGRMFEQSLSTALSRGFIRGTGTKMPKGILTEGKHRISIPKATNQVANTFIYDNILDMVARLYSSGGDIGEGSFIANKTTLSELGKLSVVVGTGGSGIFLANQQIQGKPTFSLLGLPVNFDGQMPIVGDVGDITLANWREGYLVGEPAGGAGMETEQSIHLYFNYGDVSFRAITAMDGAPWWPSEYKPAYGDSQALFISVAARD